MTRTARTASIAAVLIMGSGLIGCAGEGPTAPTATSTETEAATPTTDETDDTMDETPIRITVGDQELQAVLWDNPAAQSLIEQLPLTLDFSDYGGQEVLATPPQPLTMEGMPDGESAPAGTIGYYAPDAAVVLYYADVGRYPGIVRVGEIDGDLSILTGWTEPRALTIELAG